MPNQKKIDIVNEVQEKLQKSSGVYFANYTGLNVLSVTKLRKRFREEGVEYKVVKNNLTKIAAKNVGISGLDDLLVGQIGIAFSESDPTAPAKVIKSFVEDNDSLKVVGILFEGQMFDAAKYEELASLPSKEELLSKLVGGLNSPMSKLVGTLGATISKLVGSLNSLKDQKD